MYILDDQDRMHSLLERSEACQRRQDLPKVYALNGAVYVADCRWLERTRIFVTGETVAYPMPRERSLDIDTETDFRVAELLLKGSPS
jgi:N-acylneuraminate cytidylyltransferase